MRLFIQNRTSLRTSSALLATFLVFGCGRSHDEGALVTDPDPVPVAKTLVVCRDTMSHERLREMLDGNMAIVAGYQSEGLKATDIVAGFVAGFLINTLDFKALGDWGAQFSGGRYRIRNGGNTFDLRLIVQEPFGPYKAGDTLKENVFDPVSFVKNPSLDLSGSVSYAQGPLFSLVQGSIGWSNLIPRLKIDATKLSLDLVSNGEWYTPAWWPFSKDTIHSRMASRVDLYALKTDFRNGRIGFTYDSTHYESSYMSIRQSIHDSRFEMRSMDSLGKGWSWEGGYQSRIDKVLPGNIPFRIFVRGSVSTINGNRTGYFCDETLQDSVGYTLDDTSGVWGYFKSVRGDSIPYGLYPAVK